MLRDDILFEVFNVIIVCLFDWIFFFNILIYIIQSLDIIVKIDRYKVGMIIVEPALSFTLLIAYIQVL